MSVPDGAINHLKPKKVRLENDMSDLQSKIDALTDSICDAIDEHLEQFSPTERAERLKMFHETAAGMIGQGSETREDTAETVRYFRSRQAC